MTPVLLPGRYFVSTTLLKKTLMGSLLAATVVTGSGATASAAGPTAAFHRAPVSNPRVTTHFSLSAGDLPENLVLEPNGSIDVTLAISRQVARIAPDGTKQVLGTLPLAADGGINTPVVGFPLPTGLARAADGTLYIGYAGGSDTVTGLWLLRPGGQPQRISALPGTSVPNGIGLDEKSGSVYITDSTKGVIWRAPMAGGTATVWAEGPALERSTFLGANGLKVHGGAVWASNLDAGTIVRFPITHNGRAARVETRVRNLANVDDFAFTGRGDQLLAAQNGSSQLALVQPDGTSETVLTAADGLSNATAVAVRGSTIFVTSASFSLQKDPNLLTAHLNRIRLG